MRFWLTPTLVLLTSATTIGQINLVPNPGFEQPSPCPFTFGTVTIANGWLEVSPTSPDYYHRCEPQQGVPKNSVGYQEAHSGDAYIGVTFWDRNSSGNREYAYTQLASTLEANQEYCFSMYISLCEGIAYNAWAIQQIGVKFTPNPLGPITTNNWLILDTPQIEGTTIYEDTMNWVEISGSFIANGDEQYLTIGNFRTTQNTTNKSLEGQSPNDIAYYYIDDLLLFKCSDTITPPPSPLPDTVHLSLPNVFTPNDDNKNRIFLPTHSGIDQFNMKIYNRWGEIVFETNLLERGWDGRTFAGKECPDGTYYYVSTYVDQDGNSGIRKGAITLSR